jgi:hypothetical protein
MEDHAMSLIRNGYAVSGRRGFLGLLFSAFLALALFDNRAITAQEVKQIKLTEKQIQSFMAAYEDIAKVSFPKIISARSGDAIRTELEWQ